MTAGVLAAVAVTIVAPACAPKAKPIVVRRIVAKPVATPTPKPTSPPAPHASLPPLPLVARSPAAPAGSSSEAAIVATIERVFGPREGLIAVNVADCESGDGPSAPAGAPYHIDPTQTSGPNVGAFQVNVYVHAARIARHHFTASDMLRIEPNAIVAKDLYDEQGWGPWTCKTHAVAA